VVTTELTGRSPLRRKMSALDCSAFLVEGGNDVDWEGMGRQGRKINFII